MDKMPQKLYRKTMFIVLIVAIILMLTTNLVLAAGEGATVDVTRLGGTMVGIKIVFDEPISGNFHGSINYNDLWVCWTIPSNTLYCIGGLGTWVKSATLTIYGVPDGNVVFSGEIIAPPKPGEPDLPPPPEESPQCQECDFPT